MHDKKKRLYIAIIITVIAIAVITVVNFVYRNKNNDIAPNIPEVSFNGDIGYSDEHQNKDIIVHATTGFVFTANSINQKVDIENPVQNMYDFVVSLYLGDGTLIYQSDYIHPGDCISDIELTLMLKSGIYKNSVIAYRFYSADESHTVVSQCEFPIEIRCIN